MLQLAKPTIDIALLTNDLAAMRAFWEGVGARFEQVLAIGPGQAQHRFGLAGSVLKINHQEAPLPDVPRAGYDALLVAQEGLSAPRELADPDGNRLVLVPPGQDGITQAAVRLAVRNLDAHRRFYAEALDLPEEAPAAFRAGDSLILLEQSPGAPADAQVVGIGWRYITLQVMKVVPAHERALAAGAVEARAPAVMGQYARFSMIRDPDGNWIELSQRADLAGSLD